VIAAKDWDRVGRGLAQRIQALNAFLADVYGEQRILAEGRVSADLVHRSQGYLPAVRGLMPPSGVYVHVAGIDLVRGPDGEFLVLEDNLRTPSGVSYVLENRMVMKRVYPQIFERAGVRSVDEYPVRLREALDSGLGPVPVGHLRLSSPRRGPAAHPGGHPALQPELRRPGLDLCPQRPPGRRPRRGPSPRHPAGVRAGGAHRFRARLLLAADLDP